MPKTVFWDRALNSLPAHLRGRYAAHFERAERLELALDAATEAWSRGKKALVRLFLSPRRLSHRAD
jgi:hypothetical protein